MTHETKIAGRTVSEWREFARRDDCLDQMVPSDLRALVRQITEPDEMITVEQMLRNGEREAPAND